MRKCPCVLVVVPIVAVLVYRASGGTPVGSISRSFAPRSAGTWSDDRLLQFLRALADAVYERHVVRDENRATFGMTYEFWRDGRNYQDLGLDALHDGAWFTCALVTAHRADPESRHLARLLRYQVPFYVNILHNSDRLFPDIKKTYEDKAPLARPMRGRLPLAWDDGGGFRLHSNERLQPQYNTTQGPNHLAQDVADALLNVWLSTRDPAVAEALQLLCEERRTNFGVVPVLAFAAGVVNGRPEWTGAAKLPSFTPTAMPGYAGLYQQNAEPLTTYDDPLAWQYGQAMTDTSQSGHINEDFVAYATARVYGHALTMELFYADQPWPTGLHFFDIQEPPRFVAESGRLDEYAATAKKLMGGRGIQIAWVAAGILPDLRRRPELWEAYYHRHHEGESLLRVTDTPPVVNGEREKLYDDSAVLQAGASSLSLLSDTRNLYVLIESSDPQVTFTFRHAGPVNGTAVAGHFTARADGSITAWNDRQEPLQYTMSVRRGSRWAAELGVPYTVVPGQKQWINGIEHGRYVVELEGAAPQTVYMVSHPQRIIDRLEAYADGTIETWHSIWNELGVIPSGYRGPNLCNRQWELSDAGNYAHLIRLIALRLMDRHGRSEWQLAARQVPAQPLRAEPLPASVLDAQGLR